MYVECERENKRDGALMNVAGMVFSKIYIHVIQSTFCQDGCLRQEWFVGLHSNPLYCTTCLLLFSVRIYYFFHKMVLYLI